MAYRGPLINNDFMEAPAYVAPESGGTRPFSILICWKPLRSPIISRYHNLSCNNFLPNFLATLFRKKNKNSTSETKRKLKFDRLYFC